MEGLTEAPSNIPIEIPEKKQDGSISDIEIKKHGLEDFADKFVNKLNNSDIYSLLSGLYEKRIQNIKPSQLLSTYKRDRTLGASEVDAEKLLGLVNNFVEQLKGRYKFVELSPLMPIGGSSVLNKINPSTILQTIKGTEVVADASIILALEAARMRSESVDRKDLTNVGLATSMREVRLQRFAEPHFSSHYSSFTIATSGRDTGRFNFEKVQVKNHIEYWLDCLRGLKDSSYDIKEISVNISDIGLIDLLTQSGVLNRDELLERIRQPSSLLFKEKGINIPDRPTSLSDFHPDSSMESLNKNFAVLKRFEKDELSVLREKFPDVKFAFNLSRIGGMGYFNSLCFKIKAKNMAGEEIGLVDGGCSDWTQKLLSNSKERFIGSGIGSEVLVNKF
mgnify:CR=1 FL=1